MSNSQKDKGLRPELRILIASLLSMVVIIAWAKFFAPKAPPASQQNNKPAATSPAIPGPISNPPSIGGNPASATPAAAIAAAAKIMARVATAHRHISLRAFGIIKQ